MKLTRQNVARLKLPADKSEVIFFDEDLAGFGLRIRSGGKRTWVVQYRLGKKQRRVTLGTVESLTAEAARETAKTALAKVQLGGDPQGERLSSHDRAAHTFDGLVTRYLEHQQSRLKPRSYEEVKRHLEKNWAPFSRLSVHHVQQVTVAERLRVLAKNHGPVAANRARSTLSAMFMWAMREALATNNPVIATNKPGDERARERILSGAELVEIWNASGDDDYGRIVKLLMLTGQRRDEVGGISDPELQIDTKRWTLPSARTKNGLAHDVPISDTALAIITTAPRRTGRDYLFGQGKGSFSGWSRCKDRLDDRIVGVRKKRDGKRAAALIPWVLHDLRRTFATGLANLGVQPHVIEAALNHVSGHKSGVAGVYNRATYWPEKVEAFSKWADFVGALVAGKAGSVVPLRLPQGRAQ